ncbi:MAG TPA: SUMF1/EgtB/PvdO family nonheme iron enzyme [Candidatus Acidoferrales bacterium]|jgi:ergothioneine biosynthesis protein EgtB|nr:SUMF1/EgtB/PvdO family nonheme iron enzyme [Candidatus Acidoferrales bacterium]
MTTTAAERSSRADQLYGRLQEARVRSEELFGIVHPGALYDRPVPERHRIIFYMGHLEAFDWNLLREPLGLTSFDPKFDQLFAFGIDPVEAGLPTDRPADWPSVETVREYNGRLRDSLNAAITDAGATDPELTHNELGRLLEVAIEHRLMHCETLCYMLHQLPGNRKLAQHTPLAPSAPAQAQRSVEIPEGMATLGLPRKEGGTFGWDNEFEENRVNVPAFRIDTINVTNRDFLEFVRDGGYDRRELWTDAGWKWISSEKHRAPSFWLLKDDEWIYRAMFAEIPLPLDWPVYVSHDEAASYARWKGKELPSEPQWHRAACGTPAGTERAYPWGADAPSPEHGNFNLQRWDPVAVGSYPAGNSAFGVADLVGNGWEWTRSPFEPFPGFQSFSFYPGYSANFFDGKHFVMKGGSPRTAGCMLRRSFRNWFQPHYPYVYAKFRCVEQS